MEAKALNFELGEMFKVSPSIGKWGIGWSMVTLRWFHCGLRHSFLHLFGEAFGEENAGR